jgi:hypothetical protein
LASYDAFRIEMMALVIPAELIIASLSPSQVSANLGWDGRTAESRV